MSSISPRVDVAFKKIFGTEENKDLLISLVNSIVTEADQIADLTILNPYNPKNFANEKLSILDIKAQGKDGTKFNIEIQLMDEGDYDKRALYYWAKLYTEQLLQGQSYRMLPKTIGIHILNFLSIPESNKYHNRFRIKEDKDNIHYFKNFELHTVELKKFAGENCQALSDLISKINTSLDIWVAFLTRHHLLNKDNLPTVLDYSPLKKALTVLEVMNFTKEEREAYEDHLKFLSMEASMLEKVEGKGIAIGKEIGIVMGITKGIEIGETRATHKLIKAMLSQGLSIEQISAITGLSETQILSLEQEELATA